MSPRRRRVSVSVALASLLATAVASWTVPADATTSAAATKAAYTCESPSLNGNKLDITFTVASSPASIYVGRSATPKLIVNAIIPGNIVGLAAFFGVKSASATGTFSLKANGVTTARPFVFPRTDIPQTAKDFPVRIDVTLAALKAAKVGSVVYKPGPVAITLTGYNKTKVEAADGDDIGSVDASCAADNPNQAAATIGFVRSPTAIGAPVTYTKATRTAVSAITVIASSGITPYGKVTSVLYRGATRIKSVTKSLVAGKATTAFGGVRKKGTYKILTTYSGSGAHRPATRTRRFTVR
jgi:hypothetical protein